MPQRIQLSRAKGWRMPLNAKSVARPHAWGNPFRVGDNAFVQVDPAIGDVGAGVEMPITQGLAVELFRAWTICRPDNVAEIRAELAGFDLACFCALDQPCHADVLLEVANQ